MAHRAVILVMCDTADSGGVGKPATLYEVDLDADPGRAVREALRQHIRKVSHGTEFLPDDGTAAAVRGWAREHAIPVGNTGRIPVEIQNRFKQDQRPTIADAINEAAQEEDDTSVTPVEGKQPKSTKRTGKRS